MQIIKKTLKIILSVVFVSALPLSAAQLLRVPASDIVRSCGDSFCGPALFCVYADASEIYFYTVLDAKRLISQINALQDFDAQASARKKISDFISSFSNAVKTVDELAEMKELFSAHKIFPKKLSSFQPRWAIISVEPTPGTARVVTEDFLMSVQDFSHISSAGDVLSMQGNARAQQAELLDERVTGKFPFSFLYLAENGFLLEPTQQPLVNKSLDVEPALASDVQVAGDVVELVDEPSAESSPAVETNHVVVILSDSEAEQPLPADVKALPVVVPAVAAGGVSVLGATLSGIGGLFLAGLSYLALNREETPAADPFHAVPDQTPDPVHAVPGPVLNPAVNPVPGPVVTVDAVVVTPAHEEPLALVPVRREMVQVAGGAPAADRPEDLILFISQENLRMLLSRLQSSQGFMGMNLSTPVMTVQAPGGMHQEINMEQLLKIFATFRVSRERLASQLQGLHQASFALGDAEQGVVGEVLTSPTQAQDLFEWFLQNVHNPKAQAVIAQLFRFAAQGAAQDFEVADAVPGLLELTGAPAPVNQGDAGATQAIVSSGMFVPRGVSAQLPELGGFKCFFYPTFVSVVRELGVLLPQPDSPYSVWHLQDAPEDENLGEPQDSDSPLNTGFSDDSSDDTFGTLPSTPPRQIWQTQRGYSCGGGSGSSVSVEKERVSARTPPSSGREDAESVFLSYEESGVVFYWTLEQFKSLSPQDKRRAISTNSRQTMLEIFKPIFQKNSIAPLRLSDDQMIVDSLSSRDGDHTSPNLYGNIVKRADGELSPVARCLFPDGEATPPRRTNPVQPWSAPERLEGRRVPLVHASVSEDEVYIKTIFGDDYAAFEKGRNNRITNSYVAAHSSEPEDLVVSGVFLFDARTKEYWTYEQLLKITGLKPGEERAITDYVQHVFEHIRSLEARQNHLITNSVQIDQLKKIFTDRSKKPFVLSEDQEMLDGLQQMFEDKDFFGRFLSKFRDFKVKYLPDPVYLLLPPELVKARERGSVVNLFTAAGLINVRAYPFMYVRQKKAVVEDSYRRMFPEFPVNPEDLEGV
ncbi:hypothetical protein FJ366_01320 [Candidatus Dependentiae bacterium]|nr:hypothetical protein [Candidatus Dependentiae bacterium]